MMGNLLIVVTVHGEPHLSESPMYFLLANLSIFDIMLGSLATPKLLTDLVSCNRTISFMSCMIQIFFIHLIGGAEMLLMNRSCCIRLLASCWAVGLIHTTTQIFLLLKLPFCGPNTLDNFHCDLPQVIKLACNFRESGGKVLATCSSHLIVVFISFVPCIFVYLVPFSRSHMDKMASVFYTLIVPPINLIIYTLRNGDMKNAPLTWGNVIPTIIFIIPF
uniref:G-protein coupled receptors family 1 profile domain-containing protein n=1 Tax=Laticauda laticaudata TaxID=8630 RepID=A0A8C5RNB9_LATLA